MKKVDKMVTDIQTLNTKGFSEFMFPFIIKFFSSLTFVSSM